MSMMEKLAKAAFSTNYHPDDGEFASRMFDNDEHPAEKRRAYRTARAVLLALREPDEGMVEAMYASGAEGDPKQVASDFTAAIDHILNESGQPANPT